jgi:transposase-like protein
MTRSVNPYCPRCTSESAHKSHRRGFIDHLLGFFQVEAYRCKNCKHRFHLFGEYVFGTY